ncbi:MAG: hypothetical protein ACI9OJ_001939, partial [Myxococcota bacterium]
MAPGPQGLAWCETCRGLLADMEDAQRVASRLRRDAEADVLERAPAALDIATHYSDHAKAVRTTLDARFFSARGSAPPVPAASSAASPVAVASGSPSVPPSAPPAGPPLPAPPSAPSRSIAETAIRTVLALGVAGLVITMFTLIYSRHGAISGPWKFLILAGLTLGTFVGGLALRGRLGYARTGSALVLLGCVFVPLNWYAAQAFGLVDVPASSSPAWSFQWATVLALCAGLYAALARKLDDAEGTDAIGLPFLVVFAAGGALGFLADALFPALIWRGVGAALVASGALLAVPVLGTRFRMPIIAGSGIFSLVAVLSYGTYLYDMSTGRGVSIWPIAVQGFALMLLAQVVDFRGGRAGRWLTPVLLVANLLLVAREFSTGGTHPGGAIFVAAALVAFQSLLWRRSQRWLAAVLPDATVDEMDAFAAGSVLACGVVSAVVGSAAWLLTMAGVSVRLLPPDPVLDSLPLLGGSDWSVWAGLVLGVAFAVATPGRSPRWSGAAVWLLAAAAAFGAATSGWSVSGSLVTTGVLISGAVGWLPNRRSAQAFSAAFVITLVGAVALVFTGSSTGSPWVAGAVALWCLAMEVVA